MFIIFYPCLLLSCGYLIPSLALKICAEAGNPTRWQESILTLYMSISGGVSWIEPLQPLREASVKKKCQKGMFFGQSAVTLDSTLRFFGIYQVNDFVGNHQNMSSSWATSEIWRWMMGWESQSIHYAIYRDDSRIISSTACLWWPDAVGVSCWILSHFAQLFVDWLVPSEWLIHEFGITYCKVFWLLLGWESTAVVMSISHI